MATTFHPFPRLPVELRIQIWSLAVSSRSLEIGDIGPYQMGLSPEYMKYTSRIPPPAVMHVCWESRQYAPYKKAFFWPPDRYLWVNFQQDTICLAYYRVEVLAPHYSDVERLRYAVPDHDDGYIEEWFLLSGQETLGLFSALKEIHVRVDGCFLAWGTSLNTASVTKGF
ncbi:hypothetical protein F5Y03DRAFT_355822 [Xylaria venustula]|nr:hypothetical protein F5Y03DRAFT_355822 [Xylaria venustula]